MRLWVDDPAAEPADLDRIAFADEQSWLAERSGFLLYS
jgi:hypothetical protein